MYQRNIIIDNCIIVHFTAPTAQPDSFSVIDVESRSVIMSWDLPNEDGRNGIIISYTIGCNDSNGVLVNTTTTTSLTTTFEALRPYSFYICSVFATTSGGNGPAAMLNFTTDSDGKFQLCKTQHSNIIIPCSTRRLSSECPNSRKQSIFCTCHMDHAINSKWHHY